MLHFVLVRSLLMEIYCIQFSADARLFKSTPRSVRREGVVRVNPVESISSRQVE